MTLALIIGILLGLGSIMFSRLLKGLDERTFYALILSAIGALYVGFSWTDISSLIINIIQCFFFGALAYFGIKKSVYFLATGFILHGIFDIAYSFFPGSRLIPPHYDLFCISVDWVIGFYLFLIKYKQIKLIAKPRIQFSTQELIN
jgi:vacuolar-type H+-ATPase subunit I/STV1